MRRAVFYALPPLHTPHASRRTISPDSTPVRFVLYFSLEP
jgi:hypothetical protein